MKQVVRDGWRDYSIKHEGFTPFPYCDTLNLVTTGIGNLKDASARNSFDISAGAMAPFVALPWKMRASGWTTKNPIAGSLAGLPAVQDAFVTCKLQEKKVPGFNKLSGFKYASLTNITLDMNDIKNLFDGQTNANDRAYQKAYPTYENMPADAQFAMMSMGWAMGTAFYPVLGFDKFKAAADQEDYLTMAREGQFRGGGSVSDPNSRNFGIKLMFENAAAVKKAGADRNVLYFPGASPTAFDIIPLTGPSGSISGLLANPMLRTGAEVAAVGAGATALAWGFLEWRKSKR